MFVRKILVVDDFLPWQCFVQRMFESEMDLKIIATAADGREAVQKATELQPDVILMDVSLPKLNGFEATRNIRMLSPASLILFLSEHCGPDIIEAAFQAGASGYVLKTDSALDLLTGIRAILCGRKFVSHSLKDWHNASNWKS
jgi:DNA-binding NarL/FixJ family response regulator